MFYRRAGERPAAHRLSSGNERGRHRGSGDRRISVHARLLALGITSLALVGTATMPSANASVPVIQGVNGDAAAFSRMIGAPVADHAYGRLSGNVPIAKMITVHPEVTWRTFANARSGSSIYNNTVRWAKTLKARGGRILVAFDHEPEANGTSNSGDFIAAYRKWVTIFRGQGATNVEQVWQMTAYSFRVSSGDRRYAPKWYPGDAYVDTVGADPYNWYGCGPGQHVWVELSYLTNPALNWARAHHKQLAIPEYASNRDPNNSTRRATWIRNAHKWFVANRASIRAAFYYQVQHRPDCYVKLSTSADIQAYREMAKDPYFTAK